jgi:hypothetical protein
LRRRRFSAAQVCTKTMTVTPGTSRSSSITASISSRWRSFGAGRKVGAG